LARDRAVEDLANAKRLLLLSVGRADFDLSQVPSEVPAPTYVPEVAAQLMDQFVNSDADRTFTSATYRGYIKLAELDYRIARVNLLPKFSFNANVGHQSSTNAVPNYVYTVVTNSTTWGIYGNWTIFDGLATRGAKLSALDRKRSYERTLRTVTDQTLAQAQDLQKQLDFAWRAAQISQTRHDVAVAAEKRLEDDLQAGKASRSAVTAAQLSAYVLDLNLASSRSGFLSNWSEFVSTLCVDPMLSIVPSAYLNDGK